MNKEDVDDLINNLISLLNGTMDLETFKQILIYNYTDINGNSYFHFLTQYSFKEFCIRNMKLNNINEKIITFEKYTEIKSEYNKQIIFFIQTLLELNCDIFLVNKNNQSPLLLAINNNNYIMSKEFLLILQNLGLYTNEDYYDFLDNIIKNGNCFNPDCLELINLILSNINEYNNAEASLYKLSTNLISLCGNFSKNIYYKYNETINIVSLEYIEKDNNNNFVVKKDENQNIIQNIKNKAFKIIDEYINKNFLSIIMKFIKLGANLQYKKESAFIYLMSYPFIPDLPKFVQENKIDINFQDETGNTPLSNLINNKEYIVKISKDAYDKTFKYLIGNINNGKEKSAFYLCLMKNYLEEAKEIYIKFKNMQNLYFNSIILNFFIENKNPEKIIEFLKEFRDIIDFNLFNNEKKRSLIHYICLFFSDNYNNFIKIFSFIDNLKIDHLLKDKYERNFVFYLFLDHNNKRKKADPIQLLMYIFEKYKFNNLNEKDIFGNNLLFYAVQSSASLCVDYLLNNGAILSKEQNNNENSIFSVSLLKKDVQLFYFLYDKIKDPNIFNHKVYKPYKFKQYTNYNDLDLDQCQKGETLYDFLNKYNFDKKEINKNNKINKNLIRTNIILNNLQNYINTCNNTYNNNTFNNNYNYNNLNYFPNYIVNNQLLSQGTNNNIFLNDFNFFNFLKNDVLMFLSDYTINLIIKINHNNIKETNINLNLKDNPIINGFTKNSDEYIFDRKNSQRTIISENLILYSIMNNYEDLIRFSFNEKYNPIAICNDLISFKRYKDLKNCFLRILSENNNDQTKLLNLIDEKGQTIYHLLPFMQDNLYFCKILENHNISNIYDKEGNTPIFNACKNFNINFIETFSHYSFDSPENKENNANVNYDLFLETKNSKTPLEALYEQLNKKENKLLKIIIDISLHTKKVIFVPLIKYLIQNYNPNDNNNDNIFKLDYKTNLNSDEYIKKIIGLYQFYTMELKGNIMIKDELGNDPFLICVQNNNYDFMFNVLMKEPNIILNSTNNEGKSLIHLLLEISEDSNEDKKNLLTKALKAGFDFNIRDKDGLLPLDYALHEGDNEIINILKEYYTKLGLEFKPNTDIKPKNKINYNYNKDSDTFYNESISVSMNIDKCENLNGLVSPLFKYDPIMSFYQVLVDEESSMPYSVNLLKKDFNNLSINSFNDKKFCIQIIKDLNKDYEYLTIAVDDNSDLKTYTFHDFNSAKQKFNDLFKEITGNDWDIVKYNRLNFRTDYKKYYIFDYTYEEENAIYEYLKITIKNLYIKQKSEYGNKKIKNLIYYLLVKSYKNKFSIDENTLNVEQKTKNIIEKYKSTAIIKATTILFDLKKLFESNNKDEIYYRKKNYLINSYNDLIPYSKKINDNLNMDKIDDEISRLTNYYYIENVLTIFLGAIYNLNNKHPLDYIINALGCKIEELPKPQNNNSVLTTEAEYVYNYVYTTNAINTPITMIYKITESINDKNFNLNNYDNRYIFFHGTKNENIIGILSQGLKIAPVQAINTGNYFGNGIYLSDSFTCSLEYCSHSLYKSNNLINDNYDDGKKFMFMAEVAVGKIGQDADTYVTNMTMNFDEYYVTDEGCRIFKNSDKINYGFGTIVAREETNVKIKYLIEIN